MKIFTLLIVITCFIGQGFSQTCDYVTPKYGFRSTKGIFVGIEKDYQGNDDSLFIDIYYPVGSVEVKRPLVMWAFGGAFIAGKREDMALTCEECAKRGWVAATIDYRIGFEGISILPYDSAEVIRAGFRGAQDGKSALRYLKSRNLEDSIDLGRVWVGGVSAGSIVALATAFFNKDSEKPIEAGNFTIANGRARNDLGSINGNRFINGYDTKVQGVFNFFGAVIDVNIIEKGDDIAIFSYHQDLDPVVPCGHSRPYWTLAGVTERFPYVNGSCLIDPRLTEIGLNEYYHKAWIYKGNQHAVHNAAEVLKFMLQNANPILCGTVGTHSASKNNLGQIEIYPNPVREKIFLENLDNNTSYSIFSTNGVVVSKGIAHNSTSISTNQLEEGMYILQLQKNSSIRNWKFVKTN
ncbi:MAG: T9SS type A sorting domain-containing protein [Saprospiraceae bacterium]